MIFSIISAWFSGMFFDTLLDRFGVFFRTLWALFSNDISVCFRMFFRLRFLMVFGTKGVQKGCPKGVPDQSKIGPKSSLAPKPDLDQFWPRFGVDFRVILQQFWDVFGHQNIRRQQIAADSSR
jgi:hypothetical protein